jgi:hypothetical protein
MPANQPTPADTDERADCCWRGRSLGVSDSCWIHEYMIFRSRVSTSQVFPVVAYVCRVTQWHN